MARALSFSMNEPKRLAELFPSREAQARQFAGKDGFVQDAWWMVTEDA